MNTLEEIKKSIESGKEYNFDNINIDNFINKLKNDIIYTFDTGKRPYIEQIMLFDEEDNLILYLKRKKKSTIGP